MFSTCSSPYKLVVTSLLVSISIRSERTSYTKLFIFQSKQSKKVFWKFPENLFRLYSSLLLTKDFMMVDLTMKLELSPLLFVPQD
ncbi:hypothetical protein AZF06_13150 [Priestia endophytica]|nr:hypothetical protein AZF06_13150 [Priestia endophytica]